MLNRRNFLKTSTLAAAGLSLPIRAIASRNQTKGYFGVHPFIDNHPEAVFIMRTNVDEKMNAGAKLKEGLAFGRSVFVPHDESGVPLNISIPVKPNLKTSSFTTKSLVEGISVPEIEEIIGTTADPYFVEGVFEGIKELGVSGSQFHLREVNRLENLERYGYVDVAERVGADLRLDLTPKISEGLTVGRDYNWTEVADGMAYKKIPHLEPINTLETWMLNIAKFKAHPMGLTLCCKNLQGSIAHPYQQLCSSLERKDVPVDNKHKNEQEIIRQNYKRHCEEGIIPRWDRPAGDLHPRWKMPMRMGGLTMEAWVTRTLDNVSVTPCGLSIIEGIYGRDGDAGHFGPHPLDQNHDYILLGKSFTGRSKDFMSNIVIFGKNPLLVDNIGHWLGGHEPGNFGLFHLALERGMIKTLDPHKISVYMWDVGCATLVQLNELKRTPLLTMYLSQDYNGGNESYYHMVDEPFDYSLVSGAEESVRPDKPEAFILYQNLVNPSNPCASIEYRLPLSGFVKLEIQNSQGETVDTPVDGYRMAGIHMANWNTQNHAAGKYAYSLRINGFETKGELALQK